MEPKEPIEEFRVIIFITLERTYNKNKAVQYIINADPIEAISRTIKKENRNLRTHPRRTHPANENGETEKAEPCATLQ